MRRERDESRAKILMHACKGCICVCAISWDRCYIRKEQRTNTSNGSFS